MGVPYWAKVRHEDVWTHFHPWWMGVEHTAVSWINRSTRRIVGKTVGEMTQELLDTIGWMTVVGGLMIIAGIAILIPGPVDVIVFTLGLLGGPWGAVGALVAYNLLGVLLIVGGSAMIYFD